MSCQVHSGFKLLQFYLAVGHDMDTFHIFRKLSSSAAFPLAYTAIYQYRFFWYELQSFGDIRVSAVQSTGTTFFSTRKKVVPT